jgi:hypothetical protein
MIFSAVKPDFLFRDDGWQTMILIDFLRGKVGHFEIGSKEQNIEARYELRQKSRPDFVARQNFGELV